ncbi:MAG TPA: biotin/lipoyl-binding protein, partial [Desulfobacterales bacterium]|nr:biotin/lipoyl-binding protein [Desulfobacterales bacterium]
MTEQHPTTARRLPKKALALAVAIAAVASALVFMTRSEGTPQREKREALVPVKVAVAEQKAVPVQLQAVGTVEAFATVSIKSRIDGQLVGVHFREGQDVKKGDLLFTIDPRPYESAIKEA